MSLYDKKSSVSIPDLTAQEQEFMDLVSGTLFPDYLKEAGYDVTVTQNTFQDSKQYKDLSAKISKLEANLKNVQPGSPQYTAVAGELAAARSSLAKAEKNYKPEYSYDTRKRESEELEFLREKYGENSAQYKNAKEAARQDKIQSEKTMNEINKTFQEKSLKFLNGDFSITDSQKALIQENFAPIKASVEKLYSDSLEETTKAFGDFTKVAGENGMTVRDALGAVGAQIEQTGINMKEALSNVVSTRKELLKQGIDDATGEITKEISSKAAAMGRDPSDPEFAADINEIVSRQVKQGELELADMESRARLGIEERTGSGLEDTARRQAEMRLNLTQQRGTSLLGVEEAIANKKFEMGGGMVPGMLQVGQNAMSYQQALEQQRLMNAQGIMGAPLDIFNTMARERFAQPTSTQHGNFQDWMDGITGLVEMGASIYTGGMSSLATKNLTNPAASKA